MVREGAVLAADEQCRPHAFAPVAVHGHDDLHMIEELGERLRLLGSHFGRRDVPPEARGLEDGIERRARLLRGCRRDDVGDLLQRAPVVRHEAERRTKLDDLFDARMSEQLVEHPLPTS